MFGEIKHKLTPFWTLQLCGWGAFGFSMFLATGGWMPLQEAALQKGLFTSLGLLFTLPLRSIYQRLYDRNLTFPKIIAISAGCSYLAAMLWTMCSYLTVEFIRDWSRGAQFGVGRLWRAGLYRRRNNDHYYARQQAVHWSDGSRPFHIEARRVGARASPAGNRTDGE